MTLRLGEGIARVESESHSLGHFGVKYVPTRDALRTLRVRGRSIYSIQERSVSEAISIGELAVCENSIWIRREKGESEVLHNVSELARIKDFINENKDGPGMFDIEEENNQKRTIIRNIQNEDGDITHEVWQTEQLDNEQVLMDSIFCLQFNLPAVDEDGNILSQEEILEVAERTGNMFKVSPAGDIMLPLVEME